MFNLDIPEDGDINFFEDSINIDKIIIDYSSL